MNTTAFRARLTPPRPSRIIAYALGLVGAAQLVAGVASVAVFFTAPIVVPPLAVVPGGVFIVIGLLQLILARDAFGGSFGDLTGVVIALGLAFFGAHTVGTALETRTLYGMSFSWLLSYMVAAVAYLAGTLRISISRR